ncbi:hypothetical protein ACN4EG_12285 [Alkalinema pantanalense CENA528]|uniref:hypothetical protein n=1 Tax=Alkalinema pantanalense TaxID=1620705 RepID=UPI003D6E5F35
MSDQPTPPTPPAQPPEDSAPQDLTPLSSSPSPAPAAASSTGSPAMEDFDTPPSVAPKPSNNATVVGGNSDRVAQVLQTSQQIAQTTWVKVRPTAIQGLRGVTKQLQKLTTELEAQVEADPNKVDPIDFTPVVRTTQSVWEKLYPVWRFAIDQLRPRLPEPLKPLSDRALSGVVLGTLLLLLWLLSAIPSGKATPAPTPSAPAPAISRSAPKSSATSGVRSIESSRGQSQPVPQSLTAPDRRSSLAYPSPSSAIAPAPSPTPLAGTLSSVPLSPEQKLLVFLQEPLQKQNPDLAKVVMAVKPQATTEGLQLVMGDTWRSLSTDNQDRLANTMLQQAQQKNLTELELIDSEGAVLARSPIVGSEMVILQRR